MQTVTRLLTTFIPTHYDVSLTLGRTERTFSGIVSVKGALQPGAEIITLHAKDLVISSALIDGQNAEYTHGDNDELAITHTDLTPGDHVVVVKFSGTITDAMHGLYPCYFEHDGEKKELLATQFESHHAREVFPCIDEPAAKATFDVTLSTEQGASVLSNMPIVHQATDGDVLVTKFDTTPRMSTYLLAWVVGELHKETAYTKDGVEVNIWATPAQPSESLSFALDIAVRSIEYYNDYFGTAYPLPKSDHVALPDFSSGAMENWGLITYREYALLAHPTNSSISTKHYIATVIAHELAHQWFGNLVTMAWWNDLWLNESFATLMEYLCVDALEPDWNIWLDFTTHESIIALRRDALDGVQAVQTDVRHPDEISTLFDGAIVYAKGARLLRMLEQYIGEADFQKGLQSYFAAHEYDNTIASDLWSSLAEASGKDIPSFMNQWISQSGYPVVSVAVSDNQLRLSQEQFFIGPHEPSDQTWPIPLDGSTADIPDLLDSATYSGAAHSEREVRLNTNGAAHFISHYSPGLLGKLTETLGRGELELLDRLQLLNEQILLARGGRVSSASLVPLLKAYEGETKEAVWDMILSGIGELKKFVEQSDAEQHLKLFARWLARPQYQQLGWEPTPGESEENSKLRPGIIGLMLYGDDEAVIGEARQRFSLDTVDALNPELRSLIIGTEVKYTDDLALIDALLDRYTSSSSADLQQDIAAGLCSSRDGEVIKKLLDSIKQSDVVRPQDAAFWFVYLIRNRYGRDLAWQWLQDNWQWVSNTFSGDKSYDAFPRYAASGLVTRQQLDAYTAFFTPLKSEPALTRIIELGIGEIQGRVELIERDRHAVRQALEKL